MKFASDMLGIIGVSAGVGVLLIKACGLFT